MKIALCGFLFLLSDQNNNDLSDSRVNETANILYNILYV